MKIAKRTTEGLLRVLLLIGIYTRVGCQVSPKPPAPSTTEKVSTSYVQVHEILELSIPAVRYLRAFTAACAQPATPDGAERFPGWSTAGVPMWEGLAHSNHATGRLVMSKLMEADASQYLNNPQDHPWASATAELGVFIQFFPFTLRDLNLEWHKALASSSQSFVIRRAQLGSSLLSLARGRAALGEENDDVLQLQNAYVVAEQAAEFLRNAQLEGVTTAHGVDHSVEEELKDAIEVMSLLCSRAKRVVADWDVENLKSELEKRNISTSHLNNHTTKESLLKMFLESLPPGFSSSRCLGREGFSSDDHQSNLENTDDGSRKRERSSSTWELVESASNAFVDTITSETLAVAAPLCFVKAKNEVDDLYEICRTKAAFQNDVAIWKQLDIPKDTTPSDGMKHLESVAHVLEGLISQLKRTLDGTAVGHSRIHDSQPVLALPGYEWQLGVYMDNKLYGNANSEERPLGDVQRLNSKNKQQAETSSCSVVSEDGTCSKQGQSSSENDDGVCRNEHGEEQECSGGGGSSTVKDSATTYGTCLDRTMLLHTLFGLEDEHLKNLQHALDNLQFAMFNAGGPSMFWPLLIKDDPVWGRPFCNGKPCAELPSSLPIRPVFKPSSKSFYPSRIGYSQTQQCQGESCAKLDEVQVEEHVALLEDGRVRIEDLFPAAVFLSCLICMIGLFLYEHLRRLMTNITSYRRKHHSSSAMSPRGAGNQAHRAAAALALREAIASESLHRLSQAVQSAEQLGVDKLLVKKAKHLVISWKKRKAAQGASHNTVQLERKTSLTPRSQPSLAGTTSTGSAGSGKTSEFEEALRYELARQPSLDTTITTTTTSASIVSEDFTTDLGRTLSIDAAAAAEGTCTPPEQGSLAAGRERSNATDGLVAQLRSNNKAQLSPATPELESPVLAAPASSSEQPPPPLAAPAPRFVIPPSSSLSTAAVPRVSSGAALVASGDAIVPTPPPPLEEVSASFKPPVTTTTTNDDNSDGSDEVRRSSSLPAERVAPTDDGTEAKYPRSTSMPGTALERRRSTASSLGGDDASSTSSASVVGNQAGVIARHPKVMIMKRPTQLFSRNSAAAQQQSSQSPPQQQHQGNIQQQRSLNRFQSFNNRGPVSAVAAHAAMMANADGGNGGGQYNNNFNNNNPPTYVGSPPSSGGQMRQYASSGAGEAAFDKYRRSFSSPASSPASPPTIKPNLTYQRSVSERHQRPPPVLNDASGASAAYLAALAQLQQQQKAGMWAQQQQAARRGMTTLPTMAEGNALIMEATTNQGANSLYYNNPNAPNSSAATQMQYSPFVGGSAKVSNTQHGVGTKPPYGGSSSAPDGSSPTANSTNDFGPSSTTGINSPTSSLLYLNSFPRGQSSGATTTATVSTAGSMTGLGAADAAVAAVSTGSSGGVTVGSPQLQLLASVTQQIWALQEQQQLQQQHVALDGRFGTAPALNTTGGGVAEQPVESPSLKRKQDDEEELDDALDIPPPADLHSSLEEASEQPTSPVVREVLDHVQKPIRPVLSGLEELGFTEGGTESDRD